MPEELLCKIREFQIVDLSGKLKETKRLLEERESLLFLKDRRIAQLEKELREAVSMAIYDPLTGAVTRREMERQISLHLALLRRADQFIAEGRAQTDEVEQFSIALFDLNGLKEVNDTFGHNAGDLLIKTFGVALRTHFRRETDTVCRWGGDEFVVLLGGVTPKEKAEKIVGEFLLELSAIVIHFPLKNNPDGARHPVPVRSAFGVVSTSDINPNGIWTTESLIATADEAMYGDKKASSTGRR